MTDPVNHPAHYTEHPSGIECIQITEHMGFNLGNAVKYIWRADLKGSAIQDLEKARWYIDRELVKRGVATEPAAVRDGSDLVVVQRSHTAKAVQSWMTLDLWTDLGKNDKDFDAEYERQGFGDLWATLLGEVRALVQATTPAAAEPAEEVGHDGWLGADAYMTLRKAGISEESAESAMCLLNEAGLVFRRRGARIVPTDWLPRAGTSTEPEEQCESMSIFKERCAKPLGHEGRHGRGGYAWGYPSTPAEPAEEWCIIHRRSERADSECMAPAEPIEEEAMLAARGEGWYEGYEVGLEYGPIAASGEEYDGPINPYDVPASSPVVPTPTETGPWEDITKAPTHLTLIDVDGDHWAHDGDNWECLDGGYCGRGDAKSINKYAPFVAAEEG